MTRKEKYYQFKKEFEKTALDLQVKKMEDYTGGNNDPFVNLRECEDIGVSVEKTIFSKILDKIRRLKTFLKNGTLSLNTEQSIDTYLDLVNYLEMMAFCEYEKNEGMLKEFKERNGINN